MIDEAGNFSWRPTLKQEKFIQIPDSVKEGFYAGAVNAGKTDVLLMLPIVRGWHKIPQFKGVFLRRTMPELRNEVIPRAEDYFRHFGGVYNGSDGVFKFPSGAMFFMNHVEHEKHVHNYDSMQINYLAFDELTSFTEWMYLYLTIERVRVPKYLRGILPAVVRSGSNPGNIGHPWVYKRFIKPLPKGGQILLGRGGIKRVFIPATIDDNPHADPIYKAELDALPEAERKAKKGGDWTAYEGAVFDELRDKRYFSEPDNALHVVPEFDIPKWWPRVVSIDWGFAAMASIGYGAISPKKRVYVYRHQMFVKEKIEEWGPKVKHWIDIDQPQDIIICHSANQHRGDPHTILEQVTDALSASVRLGEKDRIGGKMLVHEYLRWMPKSIPGAQEIEPYDSDLAAWLLRNKGEVFYKSYLNQYVPPEPEENLPKLLFFDTPDIRVITDCLKSCVYEKSTTDGKKKEDVAEFPGDDPYDMLRMLLHAVDRFFNESSDAQEKLDKQEKLVNELSRTQDMTQYYRNARRLELEESEAPIQRFHKGRSGFYGHGSTIH